jgi:chromosome segregation ATPase
MRRTRPSTLHDNLRALLAAKAEVEAELSRLDREEKYLASQVRRAHEQLRYYESMLRDLRADWGKSPPLADLVRKL